MKPGEYEGHGNLTMPKDVKFLLVSSFDSTASRAPRLILVQPFPGLGDGRSPCGTRRAFREEQW